MMRVLQLYTEYIDGRPPVEEWDEWMDDENEMATQRKRKERLMKQYDEFCEELVEIGNKRDENESCSEYMINEFAKEMIYHSRAIIEFENFLTTLKDVSVDMNVDIKDAIKSEVDRWVLNLDYKCDIPVVFCTEGLTFFKKFFSRNRYVSFLCEVVRSIYVLAGRNSQKAYDILKKYVDEGRSGNRPALKTLKLWEKPSKQNKCRAFAIRTVLEAITPQDPYREDIDMINYCYEEVCVRRAMLTWNELNALATGWPVDVTRGLTEAGKKAVKRIQDLGMVMDVSHLNDKCFWGVIDLAQGPIIASHSNARSVCPAMRNLTDDMLKAIAKTGGLVGMNSMREFISEKHDEQNVEHLADHVEYIADLIGIDHIGLGFDFDDYLGGEALKTFSDHVDSPSGDGISNEAEAKNILAVLKKRGYSQEDLDKIGYKNFYRVFKEVWK